MNHSPFSCRKNGSATKEAGKSETSAAVNAGAGPTAGGSRRRGEIPVYIPIDQMGVDDPRFVTMKRRLPIITALKLRELVIIPQRALGSGQ
jgi:hypothetical protein